MIANGTEESDCVNTSDCGHVQCLSASCVPVGTEGANQCSSTVACCPTGFSCTNPKHTICHNAQCMFVDGPGLNECAEAADCPPPGTHLACKDNQCQVVPGDGDPECLSDRDCGLGKNTCGNAILELPEECDDGNTNDGDGCSALCTIDLGFHSECNAFDRCVVVQGSSGRNECSADVRCGGTTHTVCDSVNKQCITVNGAGNNQCVTFDDCPIQGGTTCSNFQCVVDPSGTSMECVNSTDCGQLICAEDLSCQAVLGSGPRQCAYNVPCSSNFRSICNQEKKLCELIPRLPGNTDTNECVTFNDCPVSSHLTCVNEACQEVSGSGDDDCAQDSDCKTCNQNGCTHFACENNACTEVPGNGRDTCSDTVSCNDPLTYSTCEDGQCKVVFGSGENSCGSHADCPEPGTHLACVNGACTEVDGEGENRCTNNAACRGSSSSASSAKSSTSPPYINNDPRCGNGIIESLLQEECDDGNTYNGDGCASNCKIEYIASRQSSSSSRKTYVGAASICGNGVLEEGEECDDSNHRDNDGCSAVCDAEIGICGDGNVQKMLGEQCEAATHDPTLPYACIACRFFSDACGNNTIDPGEECDEGTGNSDAPNAHCRLDCSYPRCGDSIIDTEFGERCDDGNRLNGDGCDRFCNDGTITLVASAANIDGCGNGILEFPEECDDGNAIRNDGCSPSCIVQFGLPGTPLSPSEILVLAEQTNISPTEIEALQQSAGSPPALGLYLSRNPLLLGAYLANLSPEEALKLADRLGIPRSVLPFAQLQALAQGQAPVGDTGPAAVVVIGSGAAAGFSWMRRKRRRMT